MLKISLALAVAATACALEARADFQADLQLKGGHGQLVPQAIFIKGGKVRVEVLDKSQGGRKLAIIAEARQSILVDYAHRTYIALPKSVGVKQIDDNFRCLASHDIGPCAKEHGFVVSGHETKDGHPCVVYESKASDGSRERIWHPTDLGGEVPLVAESITDAGGHVTDELWLKNIHVKRLADSSFAPPHGFGAESMQEFFQQEMTRRHVPRHER